MVCRHHNNALLISILCRSRPEIQGRGHSQMDKANVSLVPMALLHLKYLLLASTFTVPHGHDLWQWQTR